MRKAIYTVFVALLVYTLWSLAAPAYSEAHHDRIYRACSAPWGWTHMTRDQWVTEMLVMEANGTIPPGVIFRYWEAEHDTGKGTNVQEDGTIPAWDQWARDLEDGEILSVNDWANGDYPEIEELMFASGLVPEWMMDMGGVVRRFDDPYWRQPNPMNPTNTIYQSICWGNYGAAPSIPVNEFVDGEWISNIPTTTTTVAPATTTVVPATTTTIPAAPSTTQPAPTTTLPAAPPPPEEAAPIPEPSPLVGLPDGYDLFDAEWDGYPFEQTVLLLEERYPPGTPDRFHFRLSVAVEFLRQGGMVKGLDNLWESG
jgi:hypothetical protein